MASALPAPATLETLRPPPPTPPREFYLQSQERSSTKPLRPTAVSHLNLQTPPSARSPAPSKKSGSGTGRMGKRVVWAGRDEIHEPPNPGQSSPAIPSSAQSRAPLRSILKPSASPLPIAPSALDGTGEKINILEMLDSSIKQLAGSDRDSKVDAYTMLDRAIKSSNNLPDRVALQEQMNILTQFIQRDYVAKNADGSLDSSLVTLSLNLLATFLQFSALSTVIPYDFQTSFIDHATKTFEDPKTTKELARRFMMVAQTQNFSHKVMTLDRVGRLVNALHTIEERVTGKSIVLGRIMLYRKLIKQARNHMATHTDWVKDMFVDMLSNLKDTRQEAIRLGLEAGFIYQKGHQLYRKVSELLSTSGDNDQSYIEYIFEKLEECFKAKDKDRQRQAHVPQILSVITLFLKCPLDRWEYYSKWLKLAQMSFNCSDWETKLQANFTWNRYVYLSLKDGKMTQKSLSVLVAPVLSQLKGRKVLQHNEESKKLRRTLIGGICNLYYYALNQPQQRHLAPEVTWDVAVQPMITLLIEGAQAGHADDSMQALRILVSLLDVSTPTVWREERIQEQPTVRPDELPSIEAKWIKKHSDRIFRAIAPLIQAKFVDLANRDSLTYRLWQAVMKSVAAASEKEIKLSVETVQWVAGSLGLLFQTWNRGCAQSTELVKFYQSARNFVKILVDNLRSLPWRKCELSLTASTTLEPVATPSQRPVKHNKSGVVRTPIEHLFIELAKLPEGASDDEEYSEFFQSAFEPFFIDQSDEQRLKLTRDLLGLLPQGTLSPFAPWALGAQAVQLSLSTSESKELTPASGTEYREVVRCLSNGLTLHPRLPAATWLSLYEPFAQQVKAAVGVPGLALAVIEPLAKVLATEPQTNPGLLLTAARALFESAEMPRDKKSLEAARQKLWGPTHMGIVKMGDSTDPFDYLYRTGNWILKHSYANLEQDETDDQIAACLKSIDAFLARASVDGIEKLAKLTEGLSTWIQDDRAQTKLKSESQLFVVLCEIWTNICNRLAAHGQLTRTQFDLVEELLAAGFRSKQPAIVNKTTDTWNIIARDEENVQCSDSLRSIVSSLRTRTDEVEAGAAPMSTEGFGAQAASQPDAGNRESHLITLSTEESSAQVEKQPFTPKKDSLVVKLSLGSSAGTPTARELLSNAEKPPSSRKKRRYEAEPTSEPVAKRSSRRRPTPSRKLRHEDSQIQFQPIGASSSPVRQDSQHLTEHQMEVRDKQKDNAALYPTMRTSSPADAEATITEQNGSETTKNQEVEHEAAALRRTPERKSTYSELITSTPTPRRGQILMVDDTDPPSSPPEPRSNPLAEQIQSRSQANSSIEDWDLSSPPASPVTSRQQVAQDGELPAVNLTIESPEPTPEISQENGTGKVPTTSPDVIPSSLPPARATRAQSRARSAQVPFTPPPKQQQPVKQADPSSSKDQDVFVDAKSNQEPSSPTLPPMPTEDDPMETSYSFSQVDNDSQLANFVVTLEQRDARLPKLPITQVPSSSPEKRIAEQEKDHDAGKKLELDESISSALADTTHDHQGAKKRKRTRSKNQRGGSQRKKRRSAEPTPATSAIIEDSQPTVSQAEDAEVGAHRVEVPQLEERLPKDPETEIEMSQIEESQSAERPSEHLAEDVQTSATSGLSKKSKSRKTRKTKVSTRSTRRSARVQSQEQELEQSKVLVEEPAASETEVSQDVEPDLEVEVPEADVQLVSIEQAVAAENALPKEDETPSEAGTDEELKSQLHEESVAASESQSASREPTTEAVSMDEDMMDLTSLHEQADADQEPQDAEQELREEPRQEAASPSRQKDAIMARFRESMADLQSASLSRDDFNELEDMLFDMKRELFAAERRGRPHSQSR